MFETVLAPLDGSKPAEIIVPYVEEIVARFGSRAMLVSVAESTGAYDKHLYQTYLNRMTERVRSEFWEWGAHETARVEGKVLVGKPFEAVLRRAQRSNVSLLVMSISGSSGQGRWFLGNNVSRVLRATGKPLLVIRVPANDASIQQRRLVKRIMVPLDGSVLGAAAIPYAEELGRALCAELILFHVVEFNIKSPLGYEPYVPPYQNAEEAKAEAVDYLDEVGKAVRQRGLKVTIAADCGSAAECINKFAKTNSVDLIAMSTHGRSGIGRWVFGSVTEKVLHAGDIPVLIVHEAGIKAS
jgi:nucleotide-binding universal stress UspA family protein